MEALHRRHWARARPRGFYSRKAPEHFISGKPLVCISARCFDEVGVAYSSKNCGQIFDL
jgi:hypothetical protein